MHRPRDVAGEVSFNTYRALDIYLPELSQCELGILADHRQRHELIALVVFLIRRCPHHHLQLLTIGPVADCGDINHRGHSALSLVELPARTVSISRRSLSRGDARSSEWIVATVRPPQSERGIRRSTGGCSDLPELWTVPHRNMGPTPGLGFESRNHH